MQVFYHLVYEYQKGLRDLSLFTCSLDLKEKVEKSLKSREIDYLIYNLEGEKINVFFGECNCLDIVKQFSSENLSELSAEEDFMLGMMLGYGKNQQYRRFLNMKKQAA